MNKRGKGTEQGLITGCKGQALSLGGFFQVNSLFGFFIPVESFPTFFKRFLSFEGWPAGCCLGCWVSLGEFARAHCPPHALPASVSYAAMSHVQSIHLPASVAAAGWGAGPRLYQTQPTMRGSWVTARDTLQLQVRTPMLLKISPNVTDQGTPLSKGASGSFTT